MARLVAWAAWVAWICNRAGFLTKLASGKPRFGGAFFFTLGTSVCLALRAAWKGCAKRQSCRFVSCFFIHVFPVIVGSREGFLLRSSHGGICSDAFQFIC